MEHPFSPIKRSFLNVLDKNKEKYSGYLNFYLNVYFRNAAKCNNGRKSYNKGLLEITAHKDNQKPVEREKQESGKRLG